MQIPVYKGCGIPLLGRPFHNEGYHGEDGFGDVTDEDPVDEGLIKKEHAASAIVRLANDNPGNGNEITNKQFAINLTFSITLMC